MRSMKIFANLRHITVEFSLRFTHAIKSFLYTYHTGILFGALVYLSLSSWIFFSQDGLNLSYNDAMSHLDIARRVVDNIKPGLTQLGSVWLPLFHVLMLPTIWIDGFWRSGLSAGIISMTSFILNALS